MSAAGLVLSLRARPKGVEAHYFAEGAERSLCTWVKAELTIPVEPGRQWPCGCCAQKRADLAARVRLAPDLALAWPDEEAVQP